jgi:hypothetical protein
MARKKDRKIFVEGNCVFFIHINLGVIIIFVQYKVT